VSKQHTAKHHMGENYTCRRDARILNEQRGTDYMVKGLPI